MVLTMRIGRFLSLTVALAGTALAQRVGTPTDALDKLSVEELFQVQVTSVGRKAQQLSKAPAAAFVLTAEDIRRTGATSIPEVLQWVPGLTVEHLDGRSWIVSARGSARLYSDKILVMIDGRSLYTPLFSGVIWDSIDVPLEDIEQIEIVRGPGSVMWGPNAVNGVINIITRKARATKGTQIRATAGNESSSVGARWGSAPNERLAYRLWGSLERRTPAYDSPGFYHFTSGDWYESVVRNLNWESGRLGFRVDGQPGEKDQLMLQGDISKMGRQNPMVYSTGEEPYAERVEGHAAYQSGYIQGRWTRTHSAGSESIWQFSFDRTRIAYPFISGPVNNLTADYQRRHSGERNEVYWGVGYQQYWDDVVSTRFVSFQPAASVFRVADAVLRDEIQFISGKLMASAGIRLDYNSYRHLEYQPSFRLLYTPNARQSAWIGASRAVRVPSRLDRNIQVDEELPSVMGIPMEVRLSGNPALLSEKARSIEAGYRFQAGQRWSVDASAFASYYADLRAVSIPLSPEMDFSARGLTLLMNAGMHNIGSGRSYGGEVWATWHVTPRWRLLPSYSYLNESRWVVQSPGAVSRFDGEPSSFPHQGLLRSQFDISRTVQLDVMARARSRDDYLGLPGAVLTDVRLGWRPFRSGELGLAVHNLTNRHIYAGYPEVITFAIPLRRTFSVKWVSRF
jgi:iron complex outermembrane recepter protein